MALAGARPRSSFAIIEDARARARRRRLVAGALIATAAAFVAVMMFSNGSDGAGPGASEFGGERFEGAQGSAATVTVDGTKIYTTTSDDEGNLLYSFEPFAPGDPALSQETSPHMTSGDLKACEFIASQPGKVNKGCALLIAQVHGGSFTPRPGPAEKVYIVCGEHSLPGVISQCRGPISEQRVDASLRDLRRAIRK